FITGLEEGLFPHENSLTEQDGLEEERRLMYVAITRARRRLYLSFAQSRLLHGQTRYGLQSRFLSELPPESTKWLTPRRRPGTGSAFDASRFGGTGGSVGRSGYASGAPRASGFDSGSGLGATLTAANGDRWRI